MSNPNFGFETTSEEVAAAYADQIKGKTFLITGVSQNGLGLYTAKVLAAHSPALLILAARSQSTLDAAVAEINGAAPTKTLIVDLGSIKSVRAAADVVNSWTDVPTIDVAINNAAVMATPFTKTEDGIEQQFATNHIGHFLLNNLIMPKIIAAKGRIVSLSSTGHAYAKFEFDDYNFKDGATYDPMLAYGRSKTANMLYAVGLAERLKGKGVAAFSLHPGVIFTGIIRHMPDEVVKAMGFKDDAGNLITITEGPMKMKSQAQGTATTLVAALDPNITDRSGAYMADCKVDHDNVIMDYAVDKGNAEKLWKLSEELVGQKFEY